MGSRSVRATLLVSARLRASQPVYSSLQGLARFLCSAAPRLVERVEDVVVVLSEDGAAQCIVIL